MNFFDVVIYCADVAEYVSNWERLSGRKITRRMPRNGLEAMVDRATGYDKWTPAEDDMRAFIADVFNFIWLPAIAQQEEAENKAQRGAP